ncbi:MAG: methyltransferase [Parcubacteria group bacterium]|nr:methyltransferase [Parcubacteria group bacterium]
MQNRIRFFVEYVKDPLTVGAIAPSSRFLSQAIVEEINFKNAKVILEIGAGQGHITREIIGKLRNDQKLISFEINKKFTNMLKDIQKDNVVVIEDSAEKIEEYMRIHNIKKVDSIISSLPFTSWNPKIVHSFFECFKKILSPQGNYIQYAAYPRHYGIYKQYFQSIRFKYVFLNIPPTVVYVCGI